MLPPRDGEKQKPTGLLACLPGKLWEACEANTVCGAIWRCNMLSIFICRPKNEKNTSSLKHMLTPTHVIGDFKSNAM